MMNKDTTIQTMGVISILLSLTSVAGAEIVPVAPFTGDLTETWESFPTSQGEEDYLPDPTVIMGGAAAISNPYMIVYEPGVRHFSLASSGYAQVSDGNKGMGVSGLGETATILFDDPVVAFGAYWGAATSVHVGDPALIAVRFFDECDELVGEQVFEYSRSGIFDGLIEWHGWTSAVPIKTITYTEDRVAIDGLQAYRVPEPPARVLFCLVALSFVILKHCKRSC